MAGMNEGSALSGNSRSLREVMTASSRKKSSMACLAVTLVLLFTVLLPAGGQFGDNVISLMAEVSELPFDSLWPGFEPSNIPVVIFNGENTYAFGFSVPPTDFIPLKNRPDIFLYSGQHPAVRANRSILLDSVNAAACITRPPSFLPWFSRFMYSRQISAAVVIHEKFHVFQAIHHPDWKPNDALLFSCPVDTAESLLSRRLEVEALKRAVKAKKVETMRAWIAASLQYRHQRLSSLPRKLAEYERILQLFEGLADYVEWRVRKRGIMSRLGNLDFAPSAIRNLGYISGRWTGCLLDRLNPSWKQDLEGGAFSFLDERLNEIAGGGEKCDVGFKKRAITRKLRRAKSDIHKRERRMEIMRRDFESQSGWRIEVDATRRPLRLTMFQPGLVEALNEREMLHKRWLALANDVCTLEVTWRECLTKRADRTHILGVIIPGLQERPQTVTKDGKRVIRAPGVAMTLSSADIREEGRTIFIKIDS